MIVEETRGRSVAVRTTASMGSWVALIALIVSVLGASPAWAGEPAAPARTGLAHVRHACSAPAPGDATCFALVRTPVAAGTPASAGASPYVVDSGASSPGPAKGLTPEQLASAYGYVLGAGGSGQTVGIVDAYDDPEIENDLATFDSHYGLTSCTTENRCFKKVGQTGSPSSLPEADKTGWSIETSLDVETVHAVCPNCKILLVEGVNPSVENLADAENEAVALGATEVSNGYGAPETAFNATEQNAYNHPGVPITVSAGDQGYDSWDFIDEPVEIGGEFFFGTGAEMPNAPASLPTVVSVGGTSLELAADGARMSETVWNNNGSEDDLGLEFGPQGATGGGCSERFRAEPWQSDTAGFAATGCGTARLDNDVSAVGNPQTGFDIYDSYRCGPACEFPRIEEGWATFGGTSLSAPIVASMYALAGGGQGVAYPALTLYGRSADASSRFDVTSGANGFCDGVAVAACGDPNDFFGLVDCNGTTACNAASGFDGPSGVGGPSGLGLFKPELPTATITAPGSLKAGIPASFSASASSDAYPGASFTGYAWTWGDGGSSGGVSPSHTFTAPGNYSVTLTVTDSYGLTSAVSTQPVTVIEKSQAETEAIAKQHREEEAAALKKTQEAEAIAKQKSEEAAAALKKTEEAAAGAAAAKKKQEEEQAAANAAGAGVAGFQVGIPPQVPDAKLASTALQASAAGAVSIRVSCPAKETRCSGTVTLRTLSAVIAAAGSAAKTKAAILTLATGSFSVAGGKAETVTLHLTPKARKLLVGSHVLHARATIVAHDASGATHTTQTTVTLRPPKAGHGKG